MKIKFMNIDKLLDQYGVSERKYIEPRVTLKHLQLLGYEHNLSDFETIPNTEKYGTVYILKSDPELFFPEGWVDKTDRDKVKNLTEWY